MPDPDPNAFARRLQDRLTDLRLQVDLRDVTTATAFRLALERDGAFSLDDPRVREACVQAGLGWWLV